METIRLALLSMGYREEKPGRWLKPVGFHLFTYDEETSRWTNWFKNGLGHIDIWEHKTFDDGSFLLQLKEFEAYSRVGIEASRKGEFHLKAFDLG